MHVRIGKSFRRSGCRRIPWRQHISALGAQGDCTQDSRSARPPARPPACPARLQRVCALAHKALASKD